MSQTFRELEIVARERNPAFLKEVKRQEKLAKKLAKNGGRIYPIPRQPLRARARNLFLKLVLFEEEFTHLKTTTHVKLNPVIKVHNNYLTYKHVLKPNWQRRGLMANTGDTQLFDESFTITTLDHAKYDRVGRFGATSADSQTVMTLDINTELYPCAVGETLHCVLASSLALDGTKDDGKGWRDVGRNVAGAEANLADMFDYVCHGKIYKFEDGEDGQTIKAYISFGGLLMALEGPYKKLTPLRVDYVYLLLKK